MSTWHAKLYGSDGSEQGHRRAAGELFAQPVNEHVIWLSVKRHLANQRQGTAKMKNRARSLGRRQEAVQAEGHRPGARRARTVAAVAGRRPRVRPASARLPHRAAEEERRVALASALSLRGPRGRA